MPRRNVPEIFFPRCGAAHGHAQEPTPGSAVEHCRFLDTGGGTFGVQGLQWDPLFAHHQTLGPLHSVVSLIVWDPDCMISLCLVRMLDFICGLPPPPPTLTACNVHCLGESFGKTKRPSTQQPYGLVQGFELKMLSAATELFGVVKNWVIAIHQTRNECGALLKKVGYEVIAEDPVRVEGIRCVLLSAYVWCCDPSSGAYLTKDIHTMQFP